MLKAGSLPSPVINALSSNITSSKNKIDSQTFIELRSDIPHIRIYFSVDGTKPDPFQVFKTGHVSTFLYRGAFRLGPGRRVVKAIAVTTDGLRESSITTKYFDVNDMYSEPYPDEYADQEQSFHQIEKSPERTPPNNKKKKPRTNTDPRRSMSANQLKNDMERTPYDDGYNVQGSIEGPISPVNYAGTQINIWGTPGGNLTDGLMHIADPHRNPNYGYMTEQMLERLQPSKNVPQITDVTQEEDFWDRKPKPFSPGNGNWKKTLEHLFLNIYNYVKDEQELQELFGWKKFGRIETARLIDKGSVYQIVTTFKKPLGEQTTYEEPPPRKPVPKKRPPKRTRTPPDNEDRPYRPVQVTPPPSPPPEHHDEPAHTEDKEHEEHTPRIYTEETVQQGTLVPFADFNVERDCDNLRKAMKGFGTDEDMLIHILGNRSSDQRVKIRDQYKSMFGRDLKDDIKGDTSGNFEKILKNLLYSPVEYDCHELRRAIKGAGTDEEALIEILTSRSSKRIKDINDQYQTLFNRTLEKDIVGDTSGHLKKILVALVQGHRPETNEVNEDEAENDAKALYEGGEKKWGTDESKFVEILSNRSNAQLKAVFNAYGHFSKKDIEAAIKSETSGNLCKALLAIVRVMRGRPAFFAQQLKKALKGIGTDEDELNRVVISRCEVDMIQIKEEYENIMKRTLEKHVESDTSSHYRKILLELLKDPSQRTQKAGNAKFENVELPGYEQPAVYKEDLIQQGTMPAAPNFDAGRDADALRKAMKGFGTDEKVLISILGNRNTAQRMQIKAAFKDKLGRDLISDLKSETSGNFSKLLERLMMDPVELDCFELKQAVKGLGTDEETLIEILASRSNERIKAITESYQKLYGKPLEKDVKSDTSGDFRRLLVSLMQGNRPETTEVDVEKAKQDAQEIIDAGPAKFGTDEAKFNVLFCNRSDSQLRAIFNEFAKLTGKSIEEIVTSETSGDLRKGILAIIRSVRSRPVFFAEQLRTAMKGAGTKESTLNRILITRSEVDLVQIKEAFKRLINRDLERDVGSETSGDYKKLLLEILKDPSQR
ncbi:unnamed protein product [Adineta steineri]|uniref:Annexin n=3 Tax=Adineta steineri TaxID=433720 RepID=A0A814I5K3_9BILA|nr:unnamed protein product [Adineta steineri]CAF1009746.1 unnamed protein product [Adineta steineri]CAF1019039.1 unnamed protein product [Adineta steineri]